MENRLFKIEFEKIERLEKLKPVLVTKGLKVEPSKDRLFIGNKGSNTEYLGKKVNYKEVIEDGSLNTSTFLFLELVPAFALDLSLLKELKENNSELLEEFVNESLIYLGHPIAYRNEEVRLNTVENMYSIVYELHEEMNTSAARFLLREDLDEMIDSVIYGEDISRSLNSITRQLGKELNVRAILSMISNRCKFKSSYVEARTLRDLLREFASDIIMIKEARRVAESVRRHYGYNL